MPKKPRKQAKMKLSSQTKPTNSRKTTTPKPYLNLLTKLSKRKQLLILIAFTVGFASIGVYLLTRSQATTTNDTVVWDLNLNQWSSGQLTRERLTSTGISPDWGVRMPERSAIINDPFESSGQKVLQVTHEQQTSTTTLQNGSFGFTAVLPVDQPSLILEYDLAFGSGFQFSRDDGSGSSGWGGKLPGLAGAGAGVWSPQSCNATDGGSGDTGGFSMRRMWRQPNSKGHNGVTGPLETYSYWKDKTSNCGNSWAYATPNPLTERRWYKTRQRVDMNTVGQANGRVREWIDGNLVLDMQNLEIRTSPDYGVNQLKFSTYFGGATPDWGHTKQEEKTYYRNIRVLKPGTGTSDTTAPTVSLTSPANGDTVSGTTNITANASDNVGVTKVEFYRGSTLLGTDSTAPYSYSWNTAGTANGSHTLTAKAYDAAGNVGTSSTVNVTIDNQVQPVTLPYRINAGGDQLSGSPAWNTDSFSSPSPYVSFGGNRVSTATAPTKHVSVPTDVPASLFETMRWLSSNDTNPHLRYSIPRGEGEHTIRLYFVERAHTAAGARKFHVNIDGQRVLTDYDIYAKAGAVRTGVMESFVRSYSSSSNTVIELFAGSVDAPVISGIEVLKAAVTAPTKPGDVNGDNKVDISDLSILLTNWNSTSFPAADLNQDGVVNISDLSILLSNWGK